MPAKYSFIETNSKTKGERSAKLLYSREKFANCITKK